MPPRPAPAAPAPYSLRQIQQMLGLSRKVITRLIAAGFVVPQRGPRNAYRFSFQDVVLLRTAHQLRQAKIGPRRLLRSLKQLKAKLPDEMPLSGLRIKVIGNDVAVRDADARWEAPSGQLLLDFEVAAAHSGGAMADIGADRGRTSVGAASAAIATEAGNQIAAEAAPTTNAGSDITELFTLAVHHETTGNPTAAEHAYRRVLASTPDHLDAAINLSAMLCDAGRCADALAICDQAISASASNAGPAAALLHFNRAIALEDQQRAAEALQAYARALKLDPTLADAHYNAARLHEQLGHAKEALRHFSAYRRLQRS
ncbi:tetratricopeptide repeat protein [Piscinibacter sakaiensis]|uniref:tetratricopeptide repeat protein n=1 Tax=Piscinibacter sakaiensis TaxID=1547922 RepID=UPI003AAEE82A